MKSNFRETWDDCVRGGGEELMLEAFAALAAAEARLVQFGVEPHERLQTEQVKALLEGDDESTSEGKRY